MSQLTIETFLQQPDEIIKLNQWIFGNIQSYVKGRILEMDSGSGVFSSLFIERGIPIHLSDTDKGNRDKLRHRFNGYAEIKSVNKIDFNRPDFEQQYSTILDTFSTVVGLNFTEHGFHYKAELENAKRLLKEGGCLIVAIPSFTALYPGPDQSLEELKKYNRRPLKLFLKEFQILKTRYFNLEDIADTVVQGPIGLAVIVVARKKGSSH